LFLEKKTLFSCKIRITQFTTYSYLNHGKYVFGMLTKYSYVTMVRDIIFFFTLTLMKRNNTMISNFIKVYTCVLKTLILYSIWLDYFNYGRDLKIYI